MTVPVRTIDQKFAALASANEIRVRRAALKRALKASDRPELIVVDELVAYPYWLASMKVYDLLLAIPKFGRVKAARLLNQCRVSPVKTVGGLSSRQRDELVERLAGRRS